MDFAEAFPLWNALNEAQQGRLQSAVALKRVAKGTIIHNGSADCTGLLLINAGQLRAFILSEDGREITIYRLFDMDICLFSAACMMRNIQFDITIEAEKDSDIWVVPADVYMQIMKESAPVANYTNEIMAGRFSEVMWLIEQIMWKRQDARLAAFLVEESRLEQSSVLKITHERIAAHLGTAREVITRMLRYFQSEGMLRLSRGSIELTNVKRLEALSRYYAAASGQQAGRRLFLCPVSGKHRKDTALWLYAHRFFDDLPIHKQQQRRNAHDLKSGCKSRLFVHIDLCNLDIGSLLRNLIDDR